jgi:hypothetical protein
MNHNNNNNNRFSIKLYNILHPIDLDFLSKEHQLIVQKEKENDDDDDDIYNPFHIDNIQSYNPIYSLFFPSSIKNNINENPIIINDNLTEHNFNSVTFNHHFQFVNMNCVCDINNNININNNPVFIKFSPLLDPIRYMIGKYDVKNDNIRKLPILFNDNDCSFSKLQTTHNASYVDCFFSYLSSQILHNHHFLHSIDFYGSYLGIQEKYKMNVTDDYEYINATDFFQLNINKLFTIKSDNKENVIIFDGGSRCNKQKLHFSDTDDNIDLIIDDIEVIDDIPYNNIEQSISSSSINEAIDNELIEEIFNNNNNNNNNKSCTTSSFGSTEGSSNNSETNYSVDDDNDNDEEEDNDDNDNDNDEEDNYEEEDEEEDDNNEEEENQIYAYIKNFPIQLICLEKCDGTLDDLFVNSVVNEELGASFLFQIIMTLTLYQKIFHFTHNDLHTNNIMYKNTDIEYLYYEFENNVYKVPTYGKIFKIIDFGRSIYRFKNQILCSDSFAPQGDAHSQYNFEPFFNNNKPRLDPNYSFDLCRLACSIYDFIIDNDDDDEQNLDKFQKIIKKWCMDDNGKNILYKSNGEERYPNFKLYKMISRTVHNCIPKEEMNNVLFSNFKLNKKSITLLKKKSIHNIMNIDCIPTYYNMI